MSWIESLFFNPDPRVALTSRGALLLAGAAIAALLVAVAGPIYGVAALVALIGGPADAARPAVGTGCAFCRDRVAAVRGAAV